MFAHPYILLVPLSDLCVLVCVRDVRVGVCVQCGLGHCWGCEYNTYCCGDRRGEWGLLAHPSHLTDCNLLLGMELLCIVTEIGSPRE